MTTTPDTPARPLTDAEIAECLQATLPRTKCTRGYLAFARAVESRAAELAGAVEPPAAMRVGLRATEYVDSTPLLHVGDSAFEGWFREQPFATKEGVKQISRDSYAAGMGDPLVTYASPDREAAIREGMLKAAVICVTKGAEFDKAGQSSRCVGADACAAAIRAATEGTKP